MIKQFKQVMPRTVCIIPFAFVYILTYSANIWLAPFDEPVPVEIVNVRLAIVLFTTVLYAVHRIINFCPLFRSGYGQWLTLSPWTFEKPLPMGPVHLTWVDSFVIGSLTSLVYFDGILNPTWPAIAFLSVQTVLLAISTLLIEESKPFSYVFVGIILLPFTVFPFRNHLIALLVLVILYTMTYASYRMILKNFPWNTSFWKSDPIKKLRKQAIENRVIGFPHRIFNAKDSLPSLSFTEAIICSLLITWYLHIIRWLINEPYDLTLFFMAAILLSFFRLLAYVCPCYGPPISLWGRICKFRFIIPGYDKIFLAPICIIAASIILPCSLATIGIGKTWGIEISVFVLLLLAFSFPPSLKKWRLTGKYRMVFSRNFRQEARQSQPQLQKSLKRAITK